MADQPEPRHGIPPWIIVLIVAATAIGALFVLPELRARWKSSNERNAAACLQALAEAEADFWMNTADAKKVRAYWTADIRQLYSRSPGTPLRESDAALARADASPGGGSPAVPYEGYFFAAIPLDENGTPYNQGNGRNPAKFAFCAYPADKSSGRTVYIINESKDVWRANVSGHEPILRWPATLSRDWVKLDLRTIRK